MHGCNGVISCVRMPRWLSAGRLTAERVFSNDRSDQQFKRPGLTNSATLARQGHGTSKFILFNAHSHDCHRRRRAGKKKITSEQEVVPVKSDTISPSNVGHPDHESEIEATMFYSARDSISASIDNQVVTLYGQAVVTYSTFSLEADQITIDYRRQTVTAVSTIDSLGLNVGYPIFKEGAQLYETKGIVYNYATGHAKIKEVITHQGEAFLKSGTAYKTENDDVLSYRNTYTTCDLEDPHFKIISNKAKAIKDDKVVTGPFYLRLHEIPLPVGFLFGIFPGQLESSSGVIFPSFGEERSRGFNLRGGGYFFDISEYIKVSVTGDIYSKGAHALYANSNYSVRYKYTGGFNFSYSKNYSTDEIVNQTAINDFRITWHHSPISKKSSRFSASVDAATTTYNENNNLTYPTTDLYPTGLSNVSATMNSTIAYSKTFAGSPFSMGTNFSHSQNLQTREVRLRLPNLSLTMQNQYPFKSAGNKSYVRNLSIGYAMAANNEISNNIGDPEKDGKDSIASFDLDNLSMFFANGRKGVRQTVPISNSFTVLKYVNVSPAINYEEKWYFEKLSWVYQSSNNGFSADTIEGFNRITNYSFSGGITTKVFGMYFVKNPNRRVKAIRHVLSPSVSFTYTPDFTANEKYFQKFVSEQGTTIVKSRHEGFLFGSSLSSRSASIGFGLGNNVEMKIKSPKDTLERKVMLLNNLSVSFGYNFLAEAFKLSPVSIAANTNIFKDKINVSINAALDPYHYIKLSNPEGKSVEQRIDAYSWKFGRLGRLTSATLSLNANLNPEKQKSDNEKRENVDKSKISERAKQDVLQNQPAYVDFSIPWSLNLGFHFSYHHQLSAEPDWNQTLQASGDLTLTQNWKVTFNTGYDFRNTAFTQSSFGFVRDLHCWIMNFHCIPFGKFQSYNFSISIKASMLRDAKVEKRRSFTDSQ
jgi:hypothetical protein